MKLEDLFISKSKPIKESMQQIDKTGYGCLFVIENKKFVGIITDSDIRRSLLTGKSLSTPVLEVMNRTPITTNENWNPQKITSLLKKPEVKEKIRKNSLVIPVIKNNEIIDLVFLNEKGYSGHFNETHIIKPVKRVLVVGGAGYLGSVLCKRLIQKGYLVKVLDNLTYTEDGLKNLINHSNFEFIKGDICNVNDVVNAIKDVDAVIHLAAIVGDEACATNPEETIKTNYFATRFLAEVCKYSMVNRFIFASSCSVYGSSDKCQNETSETHPLSLYAEMKLKSEEAVLSMADDLFSPVVFRMATLFGLSDRMRFDLVVNTLTVKATFEKQIKIFGGEQWRPFLHVLDASEAYIKCLETPIEKISGQVFNIGSGSFNYTINSIANFIKIILPETEIIKCEQSSDKRNYSVSFEKSEKVFDLNPKVSVEKGIYEISQEIKNGGFKNYKNPKYSNYAYLRGSD